MKRIYFNDGQRKIELNFLNKWLHKSDFSVCSR
jgi:hypothetical protein